MILNTIFIGLNTQDITAMTTVLNEVLLPVGILGGISLAMGGIIALVSHFFSIKVDELNQAVMEALPQANCGACGFPGCQPYADYMAAAGKDADVSRCPVGGPELPLILGEILGVEASEIAPPVAHVLCKGTTEHTGKRYEYTGTMTCASAHALFSGPGECSYGCLGLGDCVTACPFDAIDIIDGVAVINEFKCKSCEKCVPACPKDLIVMLPKDHQTYKVQCRSLERGAVTRRQCSVGCITCHKCVRVCPTQAITMIDNVAVIDPDLCINCGDCYEVCPTNSISTPENLYSHY